MPQHSTYCLLDSRKTWCDLNIAENIITKQDGYRLTREVRHGAAIRTADDGEVTLLGATDGARQLAPRKDDGRVKECAVWRADEHRRLFGQSARAAVLDGETHDDETGATGQD